MSGLNGCANDWQFPGLLQENLTWVDIATGRWAQLLRSVAFIACRGGLGRRKKLSGGGKGERRRVRRQVN